MSHTEFGDIMEDACILDPLCYLCNFTRNEERLKILFNEIYRNDSLPGHANKYEAALGKFVSDTFNDLISGLKDILNRDEQKIRSLLYSWFIDNMFLVIDLRDDEMTEFQIERQMKDSLMFYIYNSFNGNPIKEVKKGGK